MISYIMQLSTICCTPWVMYFRSSRHSVRHTLDLYQKGAS